METLICYRRKGQGPKGGVKLDHCVELNGETILTGATRSEAQARWTQELGRIEAAGGRVDMDNVTRDWYGKF